MVQNFCCYSSSFISLTSRDTKLLNGVFKKIGQSKTMKRFLMIWFNFGAAVGVIFMFLSVIVLVYNVIHMILLPKANQILTPMVSPHYKCVNTLKILNQ